MKLLRGFIASYLIGMYQRVEDWDSYSDETLKAFQAFLLSANRDLCKTYVPRKGTDQ